MPDVDFLVIGAGPAGWACARGLRQLGVDGTVLLVGRELDAPYDRTLGSKGYLAGAVTDAEALLSSSDSWAEDKIDLLTGTSAMALDLSARAVQLSDGRTLSFGAACLATGSHIRRLQLDGGGLGGVHYLRTLRNSASIRADAENAEHVVLVGGS